MTTSNHERTEDDIAEPRRRGDRRRPSVSDVTQIIGLMFSVATIVWGAATIKSSVDSLREAMVLMTAQVKETQAIVNAQSIDIGRMSTDISNLKDRTYRK